MKNFVVISTFPDPREAYYLRFKLGLEGINAFIIEVDEELKDRTSSKPLKVQVDVNDVERAVQILCELKGQSEFGDIEQKIKGIKRILVPVDFSDYSRSATLFAFGIAKKLNAEIKLIHVFKDPFMGGTFLGQRTSYENFSQNVINEIRQMAQTSMLHFIDELKDNLKKLGLDDVRFHYVLKKGKPEYQIVKMSEEYKPYVIILGTKGVGQMPNDLIGSVTLKMIENTKVPILAIPEKWKFKGLDKMNVLYATDFQDSDFTAFNSLLSILEPFSVKIECVHIETDEKNPWKEMQLFKLESYLNKNYDEEIKCHIIKNDDLLSGIQEYVDKMDIDIISFTSPKRSIFYKLLYPNNLKKMIYHSQIPLLIFHSNIQSE
ncbi:MAG: universal stress protein [Bacteroidota bacterium]